VIRLLMHYDFSGPCCCSSWEVAGTCRPCLPLPRSWLVGTAWMVVGWAMVVVGSVVAGALVVVVVGRVRVKVVRVMAAEAMGVSIP
jgi:hypothetical protein